VKVKFLITCFLLFPLLITAEARLKVEKLLETDSISKYNAWVMANKDKYKGLNPLLLKVSNFTEKENYIREFEIRYYDETGKFIKKEVLKGWIDIIIVREDGSNNYCPPIGWGERIIIRKGTAPFEERERGRIVKSKSGNILFTAGLGLLPLGPKLYLSGFAEGSVKKILNNRGEVLNTISNVSGFRLVSSKNFWDFSSETGLLITKVSESEFTSLPRACDAVLIDSLGNVLWRKKFEHGVEVAIAGNGSVIAIAENSKIYLYDTKGILKKTLMPFPSSYRTAVVSFSPDGKYLFASSPTEMCLYDITKDSLLWLEETQGQSQIYIGPENSYIATLDLSGYLYIFSYDGKLVKEISGAEKILVLTTSEGKKKYERYPPYVKFMPGLVVLDNGQKITIYKISQ